MNSIEEILFYLHHNPLARSHTLTVWQASPIPPYDFSQFKKQAAYLHTSLTTSYAANQYRLQYYFQLMPNFITQRHKCRYDALRRQRRAYIPIGFGLVADYVAAPIYSPLPKRYGYAILTHHNEVVPLHKALTVDEYHTLKTHFPYEVIS